METMVCCFSCQILDDFFLHALGRQAMTVARVRFYSWLPPSEVPLLLECAAIKMFFPKNTPSYSKKGTE